MKKLYSILTKTAIVVALSLISFTTIGQNTFSGNVLYHGNPVNPIHSVVVTIQDLNNTYIQSVTTDDEGYFELTNIPYGSFTISAETELPAGGIELSDAFMVMMHMFGVISLEGYPATAADVNNNGMIDWGDYWDILIGWIMYQFPFNNDPWLFDAFEYTFTQSKDGQSVGGNELGATCSGDIGGSYIIDDDKEKSSILTGETITAVPGETIDVTFTATEDLNLAGLYLGIQYDESIVTILDYETNPADMEYRTEEIDGMLGFNWMSNENLDALNISKNDEVITLTIKIAEDANPQEIPFTLDDESAYIAADGKSQNTIQLLCQHVNIIEKETATSIDEATTKVSMYPNPATEYIVVEAQNQNTLTIRDLTGKAVISTYVNGNATIDVRDLAPGYYFYQLTNQNNETTAGKLLIK